jgi:hypothetical protein
MNQDQEGMSVVLSSVQLAAVLTEQSVDETATATNRLWGGLRVVGGVLELLGAGVLCVTPEPTMSSKVGCVVFGAHGADTTSAGIRQVWTGRDSQSLTHMGTAALAQHLGADPATANNIGLAVDIAVPLGVAAWVGASRVAAVRAGRITLAEHEAIAGSRVGGHTIAKHVGRTEQQLRARLAAEPRLRVASTFTNLRMAEDAISKVLRLNAARLKTWAQTVRPPPLRLSAQDMGSVIGTGVVRATGQMVNLRKVTVILKFETYNGMPYYVLTAYLEL